MMMYFIHNTYITVHIHVKNAIQKEHTKIAHKCSHLISILDWLTDQPTRLFKSRTSDILITVNFLTAVPCTGERSASKRSWSNTRQLRSCFTIRAGSGLSEDRSVATLVVGYMLLWYAIGNDVIKLGERVVHNWRLHN